MKIEKDAGAPEAVVAQTDGFEPDLRPASIRRSPLGIFWNGFYPWLIPLGILLVWWVYSRHDQLHTGTVPGIGDTWRVFVHLVQNGTYWEHVAASVGRVIGGFLIAALIAIPLGIIAGLYPHCKRALQPTLEFLRQVPPVALVPLLIIWLGLGEAPKLVVIAYAAFFPIFLNTEAAVASIGREYDEVAKSLRLSPQRRVAKLLLPASSVGILTGLRLGLGLSWRALVAAEMLAAYSGLGYMIMSARALVRMEEMFIGIFSVGVLGVCMDWAGRYLQNRLQPWLSAGGRQYAR